MTAAAGQVTAPRAARRLRDRGTQLLRARIAGVLAFLVALVIVFGVSAENFLTVSNGRAILLNASVIVLVACAEAVVVITRNFDLSVGSIVGLAAFLTGDFAAAHPDVGAWLLLMPLAIGAGLGAINGLIVAYGRVSSVIATLGTLSIYRGALFVYADGGQIAPQDLPRWVLDLASAERGLAGIPLLVLIALLVISVLAFALRWLPWGRQLYAVGSNPDAGPFYGLRSQRVVLGAYVVTGALAGFAGLLFASQSSVVVAYTGTNLEFIALAAVVIGGVSVFGGTGSVIGVALGTITLQTLDNGLVQIQASEFARQLTAGLAIIVAVTIDALIARQLARVLRSSRRSAAT